jgi:hypothetical protein
MSISAWILELYGQELLFPILPTAPGATVRRAMFATREVRDLLQSPEGDSEWEQRVASLQADLERFVVDRTIDPKYLFLLSPRRDAAWEIRSVRPSPSIRVLGHFAHKDIFVATTFAKREDLNGWQSEEWKAIKRRSAAIWRRLFQQYQPRKETRVQDLVSGALNGRYFK